MEKTRATEWERTDKAFQFQPRTSPRVYTHKHTNVHIYTETARVVVFFSPGSFSSFASRRQRVRESEKKAEGETGENKTGKEVKEKKGRKKAMRRERRVFANNSSFFLVNIFQFV